MHKFLKILVAVLSLVGIISLFSIIAKGEDEVKSLAAAGDTALLEPMIWIAYIILALTLLLVILFIIINLFSGGANIKNTLIAVGAFLVVLIIGYAVSGNDPLVGTDTYAYDDVLATESESRFVGGGLIAFYILSIVAIVSMIYSGVKKIIK